MVPLACSAYRRAIIIGADSAVFVLTFGAVEHFTLVSAVCVRRKECESPVYRVRMWADIPYRFNGFGRDGRKNIASVDLDASSSNKPSDIAFRDVTSYLAVPPSYLVYNILEGQSAGCDTLTFSIRIDCIADASSC
nr:uncharacterized protein LOC127326847 [Lolium perenne]